jgi:hypothetical protein
MATWLASNHTPRIGARAEVEQGRADEVAGFAEVIARAQVGAARGKHHFVHQVHGARAGPVVRAEVNGRIDIVETEIERVEPGFEIDGDPRIGREKGWQSGREPAGAERGQDGKGQRSAVGIGAKAQCGAEIRRKASRMSRA